MIINALGILRKPSGRLNQHKSAWRTAGKTESSGQIVLHMFRADIKGALGIIS